MRNNEGYAGYYWILQAEEEYISYLLRKCAPACYLEIGTLCGILLAKHAEQHTNTLFYAVDPFDMGEQSEEIKANFFKNTQDLENVKLFLMKSDDAVGEVEERIDMLFIDGDHSYGQCYADLVNYFPLVNRDGFIILHDFNYIDEVKSAALRFIEERKDVSVHRIVDTTLVLRKRAPSFVGNSMRMRFFALLASTVYNKYTLRRILKLFGRL